LLKRKGKEENLSRMIKNIVLGQTGTDHGSKFSSPSLTFSSCWIFYTFLCNINLACSKILWCDSGSELPQKCLPLYHTERNIGDDDDEEEDESNFNDDFHTIFFTS
jgi:hypothetical protein